MRVYNIRMSDFQFPGGFIDASFGATWRAFSLRQPYELISLDQKRVCFRQVMLPLLARQRLGLYYNMPVVCSTFLAK